MDQGKLDYLKKKASILSEEVTNMEANKAEVRELGHNKDKVLDIVDLTSFRLKSCMQLRTRLKTQVKL